MDDLPDLVQFLLDARFRPLNSGLAQIDSVGEQRTTRMDTFSVTAIL